MSSEIIKYRRPVIVLSQAGLLILTYYFSFLLRLDFVLDEPYRSSFLRTLPLVVVIKLLLFWRFRLFTGWWRFVGMSDLLDITKASAMSAPLVYVAVRLAFSFAGYPRSIFIIDPILTVLVIGGTRFAVRAYTESTRLHLTHANTLIVGAGRAGTTIARELKNNERLEYNVVGFVDDDPAKKNERIQGIRVLGKTEDLPRLIAEREVAHILIAIPSATGRQIQRVVDKCRECRVDFKTLPAFGDIINGSVSSRLLRYVRVEDLLAREPVRLELGRIREKFQGKVVMITGAGGSVGSELVRQTARFNPAALVLYERSENDLHRIDVELADRFPRLRYTPVIGDILDGKLLKSVMAEHKPHSLFHAAAYKHVPMMEKNCFQAVTNNVLGTQIVAAAARDQGVGDFVLVSTDKAVRPSSIMGLTKRIAEIIVLGHQGSETRFVSVRFGNVLGSSGSVTELFEQQIAARSPVTITDPEARRYFMTVPEAVQLVLQASTMGNGGEIFVLDMGEPVKIVDLAGSLIKLSGLEPGVDVPIVYTGLRPGEKLFEEISLDGEGMKPTAHEKIRVFDGGRPAAAGIDAWLAELQSLVEAKDLNGLLAKMQELVPEYTPSPEILALAARETL